jgi:hypothetical protein
LTSHARHQVKRYVFSQEHVIGIQFCYITAVCVFFTFFVIDVEFQYHLSWFPSCFLYSMTLGINNYHHFNIKDTRRECSRRAAYCTAVQRTLSTGQYTVIQYCDRLPRPRQPNKSAQIIPGKPLTTARRATYRRHCCNLLYGSYIMVQFYEYRYCRTASFRLASFFRPSNRTTATAFVSTEYNGVRYPNGSAWKGDPLVHVSLEMGDRLALRISSSSSEQLPLFVAFPFDTQQ